MSLFLHRQMLMQYTSGAALSVAETLALGEANALAIGFTDRSLKVVDTGTPANDRNYAALGSLDTFSNWFTYTSPSAKMVRYSDGLLKYAAHNLYLNSASPANQSITVVSSATYSVIITGSVSVTASGAATGTWTAGTNNFTASTTTLTLGSTSGSGTVQVTRTPADTTHLVTTGTIRYALPLQYDVSANAMGLCVERAATNLNVLSATINGSGWTTVDVTLTAASTTGPDGTTNGSLIAETATSAIHRNFPDCSFTSGTRYVASVWLKKGPGGTAPDIMQMIFRGGGHGSGAYANFNISTGAVTASAGSGLTAGTESWGNGWYRCWIAMTATGTSSTAGGYICFCNNNGTATDATSYAGATTSNAYIFGFQNEAGSYPSSYIPTFAATVTRAIDNISVATSIYPHSATENTAVIEYRPQAVTVANLALRWDDNTANEVVSVGHDASANIGLTVTDGGAAQTAPLTSGTATAHALERIGVSWKANDFLLSDNGATAVADTSGTLPTVTTLDIGPTLTGHITELLVIPVEKSAAQVEALSA